MMTDIRTGDIKTGLIRHALRTCFFFIASIFFVFYLNQLFGFTPWGIIPREIIGLRGVVTAIWFHGSLNHLLSNCIPLFFLLMILKVNFSKNFFLILLLLILFTGALVWIFGSKGNHIGASGLVFALCTFLISSSIKLKEWTLLLPLAVFLLFYSNLFWGLIPSLNLFSSSDSPIFGGSISYSSHWAGFIVGFLLGFKGSFLLTIKND